MKEITPQELRTLQMEILSFVDDLCQKNGLRYSLCGGTLLGAVRHKGYIPWDDDIDIFLPRPDYEKLIAIVSEMNSKFKALNSAREKNCFITFSKIINANTVLIEAFDRNIKELGVYVDVFPVDGLPNDEKTREKYWNKIRKIKNLNSCVYTKKIKGENFIKGILRKIIFFYFFINKNKNPISKKINRTAIKNDYETSEFIACSVFGYDTKEQMPKFAFEETIDLDFEGKKFKALKGYDIYLSGIYGNYMQLPPKEKQVAKHDFVAYWKD